MKTNINTRFACIIIVMTLVSTHLFAQQPTHPQPANISPQTAAANASYTYKVFQAPNKMYGFDILKNTKLIFHQPASNVPASSIHPALGTAENAEKAAQFSIDKIKKGQQPSMLTDDEIKKIITQ
jgi:hypothetical protein